MRVDVLGPVRATSDAGSALVLGAPRQRAVLVALALDVGRSTSTDRLVHLVWGEHPPPGVTATLQAYVSGLRSVLEPGRARGTSGAVLVTVPGGYRLALGADDLDAARFAATAREVRRALAPRSALVPAVGAPSPAPDEVQSLAARLEEALGLWRGEPYEELGDAEDARLERDRLAELRLLALEDRAVLGLWAGHDGEVAAELDPLLRASPWRERLAGLRALALARTGRQADALAVLDAVRAALDDELGLQPGPELRALQTAVLRQDPALRWSAVADPPVRRTSRPSAGPPDRPVERWPLVGRDAELGTLLAAAEAAVAGRAGFVGLVGEPGIGKSRLTRELVGLSDGLGLQVLAGRCSQDEGAPPLWPWATVLRTLGRALPDPGPAGSDFAAWEGVVDALVEAAGRPTLLVLDDLHWADPATLRVLRLLVEHPAPGRLLAVLTWRPDPPPSGALADLVEALGRRHAARLTLSGLGAADAAAVVEAVTGDRPDAARADRLRDRTDGNPFFLVEYASLLAEQAPGGPGLDTVLTGADPPDAVQEVLRRRLDRLPDATATALRRAAVAGRDVELDVLAAAAGEDVDDLLDVLEPAVAAGLLREEGVDRFRFAHALVAETAARSLPASRRARVHAALAAVLEQRGGRETEVARHWAAAGDAHVDQAWRAAVTAARTASRLHDREQAAALLTGALALLARDPVATGEDRFEVLLDLVEAYRWSGRWPLVVSTTAEAVAVARGLDDPARLARAASGTVQGTVWQSNAYGRTDPVVVTALRDSLRRLPGADDPLRARAMLALAVETYYGSAPAERGALVDEALAMAERLGDDALLLEGHLVGFAARWRPSTAAPRLAHARAARELAVALGQEQAAVVALVLVATAQAELGDLDGLAATEAVARREATRLHLPYSQVALDELVVGLQAMAGRLDEADATLARIVALHERIGTQQTGDAVAGSRAAVRAWQGRWEEVVEALDVLRRSPLPTTAVRVSLLLRAGRRADAEALLATEPVDVDADDWLSLHTWCHAAEAALAFGDARLASQVYARLAPYAGRLCTAGSNPTGGPVDAYLALAARTVGEHEAAARHADRAEVLLERWALPLAAEDFRRQRLEHGI